uniref:Uncharacterized protein n=1 Tax=Octopus bimaculoides TaxID=37653 RepID=A0A0L8FT67_OCTBM
MAVTRNKHFKQQNLMFCKHDNIKNHINWASAPNLFVLKPAMEFHKIFFKYSVDETIYVPP